MAVRKKGQGAMEFIMAYGWAIIAVIITIAALAYFGVLNPNLFVPESCTMFPGIGCSDFHVNKVEIILNVKNGGGISFDSFSVGVPGCLTGNALNGLSDGEQEPIIIPGCSFVNEKVIRKDLQIAYSAQGVSHTKSGKITTVVDNNHVANSDFEFDSGIAYQNGGDSTASNNLPDGWKDSTSALGLSTAQKLDGVYSEEFSCSAVETFNSPSTWFRQVIPVLPNQAYRLTFWGRKSQSGGRIVARVDANASTGTFISTALPATTDSTLYLAWGSVVKSFTTPANTATITLYFYNGQALGCSDPKEMFLDGIKLEKT